jgi:hypothetical protein
MQVYDGQSTMAALLMVCEANRVTSLDYEADE